MDTLKKLWTFILQDLPRLLRAEALYEDPEDEFLHKRATTPPPRLEPQPKLKLKKSASMKLKWFPAFRRGGQNHHTVSPPKKVEQTNLSVSTTSLLRRSSSKLNVNSDVALNPSASDYGSSATPILLSVRKRSTSDSGYSGESNCDSPTNLSVQNQNQKAAKSRNTNGLSFLRLFHKSSATLHLQHPKTELNPDKPYKGQIVTSLDNSSTSNPNRKTKKEFLKKQRKLPLVPMASSSLSSLNTLNSGPKVEKVILHQVHHSSSNSVISSTDNESSSNSGGEARESSSNYDSGAFSRSSSPTDQPVNLSLSMSRLALTEPLLAPKLVLAACRGEWPISETEEETEENEHLSVKKRILKFQNHHRSQIIQHQKRQLRARSMSLVRPSEDVTVSVGANTKLTIGSPGSKTSTRNSNLRRSRSGLPVLGATAAILNTNSSPKKLTGSACGSPVKPLRSISPLKKRNKISTVYLDTCQDFSRPSPKRVRSELSRSGSIVTVMGSQPAGIKCDCNERVTVNGQHHCAKHIDLKRLIDRSTNTTPIGTLDEEKSSQPTSLINI